MATKKQEREMFKRSSKVRILKPNKDGQLILVGVAPKSGIKHHPDEMPEPVKVETKYLPAHLRYLANIKK